MMSRLWPSIYNRLSEDSWNADCRQSWDFTCFHTCGNEISLKYNLRFPSAEVPKHLLTEIKLVALHLFLNIIWILLAWGVTKAWAVYWGRDCGKEFIPNMIYKFLLRGSINKGFKTISRIETLHSFWLAQARLEPIIKFRCRPDPARPDQTRPGQTHKSAQTQQNSRSLQT